MKILFKNGRIIEPISGKDTVADILIENGIIEKLGDGLTVSSQEQLYNLDGKIVAPGFLDMHVHLREPGFEYQETIETGALAAANGGFTGICCMPNTNPAIDDAAVVKSIKDKARNANQGLVDVYPIGAITKNREGKELAPMMELTEAGVVGFSDDGASVDNSEIMRRAFEYASMLKKPIIQHAEDLNLSKGGVVNEGITSTFLGMSPIPSISESIIISRDIQIAEYTKAQYHAAHISVSKSVELIRSAKERHLPVSCEVTPHHFTLTDEMVRSFDTNMKMKPPLRTCEDIEVIKNGLQDGTIDVIATDHAPHSFDEKQVEFNFAPFGIIGLETALGIAVTELVEKNIISLNELIKIFSSNPRKILHLPQIRIEEGRSANLTIFDPKFEWIVDINKFKSKSRNSPFHGMKLIGKAFGIVNNSIIYLSS